MKRQIAGSGGRIVIRPVGLLDIPLLGRLQSDGVQFDPIRALTRPESVVATALRAPLAFHQHSAFSYIGQTRTRTCRLCGLVQLRGRKSSRQNAEVTFIAPALDRDGSAGELWSCLLEVACRDLVRFGVQRVFTSLPAESEDAVPFLNAGFIIFAREELLSCKMPVLPSDGERVALRPETPADSWSLQRLYANVVPLGVKQAEGLCESNGKPDGIPLLSRRGDSTSLVYEHEGEIVGHVELTRGKIGHWVHFTLLPTCSEMAGNLVKTSLEYLRSREDVPVFCHIRTYESFIKPALQETGFEVLGRRDIAVRQALSRIQAPVPAGKRVLDTRAEAPMTSQLSHSKCISIAGKDSCMPANGNEG